MLDTVQQTEAHLSKLRELRERAGCSVNELAREAGVVPNTIRNAERGKPLERATQRAIGEALSMMLQRRAFGRIGDARAGLIRAELELEAAQARAASMHEALDEAEALHASDLGTLRAEIETLWRETQEEAAA
jgi:DNA-binding XRE family transcriptional regulator